jgi:very-short-patch-repair endonuclease
MAPTTSEPLPRAGLWALVRRQHGVLSRRQLLDAGLSPEAIRHRLRTGRLYRQARSVYAVGRQELGRPGEMMVAVLAAGPGAVVSHETAAELWGLRRREPGPIEVSAPTPSPRRHPGIRVHNRRILGREATAAHLDVPVTTVVLVLIDMARRWPSRHLEAAVNQADALGLLDPVALRRTLGSFAGQPGVRPLRQLLDAQTFRLTDSELERRFLRLVRRAGLPLPETRRHADGWRVDFLWPELGLVVETDSLRYHRTPSQQTRDQERDHAHRLAGRRSLRFTHWQVAHAPAHVVLMLRNELALPRPPPPPAAPSAGA